MLEERIYSVTEFNRKLKEYIETNALFSDFFLKGELSTVSYYKSGHLYFNLKDKDSQIKCAAFNYKYKKIAEDLKEGDQVKIFCDLGVYENRGEVQILVRHIEKLNQLGEKFLELAKLRQELELKGYFSQEYKKPLPKYPKNIGVVTAFTGAALQDIIKTAKKRDPRINIYVYPSKVQGVGAKEEIVRGIEVLNKIPEIDLIIAGRGGGSIEDLWCFNEREVAIAFFNSVKPIISAVGHEVDHLLTDLTADARAATPTQAIEMCIPEKREMQESVNSKARFINKIINSKVTLAVKELNKLKGNYYLKNFSKELNKLSHQLVLKEEVLNNRIKTILSEKSSQLNLKIESIYNKNPIQILQKGYSITTFNGKVIKNIEILEKGDKIKTRTKDGVIFSIIEELKKNEIKS
ncbi:MAG: exodeoxyribonuclease VII large subunit [Fusobacteriaceae bacterium]|nr:exodeoxyribonuclease VII large subunit [Fusobacteriaceae bacterium]MBP6322788.1 exodeoxyribonuclease VII large subunit [Fusobacteriaceae bacterium]